MHHMGGTNNEIKRNFLQKIGKRFCKLRLKSKLNPEVNLDLVFKSIRKTLKLLTVCRDVQGKIKIFRSIRIIRIKMFSKTDSRETLVCGSLDSSFHRCIGICGKEECILQSHKIFWSILYLHIQAFIFCDNDRICLL